MQFHLNFSHIIFNSFIVSPFSFFWLLTSSSLTHDLFIIWNINKIKIKKNLRYKFKI